MVLAIFQVNFKSFIEIVTYRWDLFLSFMTMFSFIIEGLHFIRSTSTPPLGKVVRKKERMRSRVGYEFPF